MGPSQIVDLICAAPIIILCVCCGLMTIPWVRQALSREAARLEPRDIHTVYVFMAVFAAAGVRLLAHAFGGV